MLTHVLIALMRILTPHCDPLPPPPAPLYTTVDWQRELAAKEVCQCITLKIGPDGATIGNSRPCRCDE